MTICTNCNGKGYNTVFVGAGGYTDFGPREYIETTPLGIQKIPCKKCQTKNDINDIIEKRIKDGFQKLIQPVVDELWNVKKTSTTKGKGILTNITRKDIIFNIKEQGIFQLTPYDKLRWDSPISVHIPSGVRNEWYTTIQKKMSDGDYSNVYDVDESAGCQMISIKHLEAILNWRDNTKEKEEIDLSL